MRINSLTLINIAKLNVNIDINFVYETDIIDLKYSLASTVNWGDLGHHL